MPLTCSTRKNDSENVLYCRFPFSAVAATRYAQAEKRQRHSKLTMKMEY